MSASAASTGDKAMKSQGTVRKQILVDSALETKFHGLPRTVSDRHPALKLLWLLGFLALVGLLLRQLVLAVVKMYSRPVATSIVPNTATFQFPDIHFCSYPIVSASFPSVMSADARNYSDTQMSTIMQLLSKVGQSSLYTASLAFVGTVPYAFLSRNFGMRKEQSIIKATVVPMNTELRLGTDILDLKHYKYLNCFTIRPKQETVKTMLGNVLAYIDIALFADASYNQTVRFYNNQMDARGLSFLYYEALLGSGFRIYFTPQGVYPDDYSPSVTVGPGYTHYIKLSMKVSTRTAQRGQCLPETPDVQFLDQATLQPVNYKYTLSACYAVQLFGLFAKKFSAYLPWVFPVPYAYRDLPSAYNFSNFNANTSNSDILKLVDLIQSLFNGASTADTVSTLKQMQDNCENQAPCQEVAYRPSLSSIRSPLKQSLKTELYDLIRSTGAELALKNYSTPGRDWLLDLMERALLGNSSSADAHLKHAVAENVLRLQIRSAELTSTEITQSVYYNLLDLMVEVGGLMSLFIGGSVLTLLELVELCVCLIWGRKLEPEKTADSQIILVEPRHKDK